MINIKLTSSQLLNLCEKERVEGYVYMLPQNYDGQIVENIAKELYLPLNKALESRGFKGDSESFIILNTKHEDRAAYLIVLGLGGKQDGKLLKENYRRALGRLVRLAETNKIKSLGLELPDGEEFGVSQEEIARETAIILNRASYYFNDYITDENRKINWNIDVNISVKEDYFKKVESGLEQGKILSDSINSARYFCDLPPSDLTPEVLASKALDIAKDCDNIKISVFDKAKISALKMGGVIGVSKGSQQEPKFVILEYNCGDDKAKTYGIVGKGVTFDSGGLSLKPAVAMETMKDDMAGASVVINTMKAVSKLKPKVNVIAFTPLVENMPSGSALKPGDIIKFYNGKTAEVKNTDAEGRLILADALSYAVSNYKLDYIIDFATLTGACLHALGPFYAGIMSRHKDLENDLLKHSKKSGDRLWPLPLDEDYERAIKSDIADISNIGSNTYKAGTITAAMFLKHFVGNTPWAHVDIAGVAFGVPDLSYYRPGATGFGIGLLINLFMDW